MAKFMEFFKVPSKEEQYKEDVEKLDKEVKESITPMVLNGEMYLAYRGTPLIKECDLKKNIVEAVEEARCLVKVYNLVEMKKKYGIE